MKRMAVLLAGLFTMGQVFSQTDLEKKAITQFHQDFNAAAYEAMYQRFSPKM
ncbi:hypothetical protein [Acinetobacter sp.]|uniref:hypothetical protein n=1 Tax=Acinetobacter sp. TaxID=472 RepID=UPI003BB0D751